MHHIDISYVKRFGGNKNVCIIWILFVQTGFLKKKKILRDVDCSYNLLIKYYCIINLSTNKFP